MVLTVMFVWIPGYVRVKVNKMTNMQRKPQILGTMIHQYFKAVVRQNKSAINLKIRDRWPNSGKKDGCLK